MTIFTKMKLSALALAVLFSCFVAPRCYGDLIVHHAFDSISGSTFTDSAGNYNGTAGGSTTLDTVTTKLGGGSAHFNGSSNVDLGVTDADLAGVPGFTVTGWIMPETLSGEDQIFNNTSTNRASVIFRLDGTDAKLETGLYTASTWSGNPNSRQSTDTIAANDWSHVALVWDGDDATVYVNGAASGSWDLTNGNLNRQGSPPTPSALLGDGLQGNLDDISLWNEALSGDEMQSLFDVASSTDLQYDVSTFDLLKQIHDAGTGSIDIGGLTWNYADGLAGAGGLSGSGGSFSLILNSANGTGLVGSSASAVPEPNAIAVWLMLAAVIGLARRKKSKLTSAK